VPFERVVNRGTAAELVGWTTEHGAAA
jgi:hypothetical protein